MNKYVEAEILNHRLLRHPHVIEFKKVFLTPEFICIAMEFAEGAPVCSGACHVSKLRSLHGMHGAAHDRAEATQALKPVPAHWRLFDACDAPCT